MTGHTDDVPIAEGVLLDEEGRWRHAGELFTNPKIIELMDRSLTIDEEGRTMVVLGSSRALVEVAEFTYFVRDVWKREGAWYVLLNDGSIEPLDVATLVIEGDGRMICRVKEGAHPARLLRHAYHTLGLAMDWDEQTHSFLLEADGVTHEIQTRLSSDPEDHDDIPEH